LEKKDIPLSPYWQKVPRMGREDGERKLDKESRWQKRLRITPAEREEAFEGKKTVVQDAYQGIPSIEKKRGKGEERMGLPPGDRCDALGQESDGPQKNIP